MIAVIYTFFFFFDRSLVFLLDIKMSTANNQSQTSNKKQRRKNARANKLDSTRPPDNEQNEINQTQAIIPTQTNDQQETGVCLIANGIQGPVSNINAQAENV